MTSRPAVHWMVALGSSFAAGPGLRPVEDRLARRSARNYPHLVAQALGAELVDTTVSGATTENLLRRAQRVGPRKYPPQVLSVNGSTDLVTITAGGNDLGYLTGLTMASLDGWLSAKPLTRVLRAPLHARSRTPATDEAAREATRGLVDVVTAIRSRAPAARVLLVDYLSILGPNSQPSAELPLNVEDIERFADIANRLTEAFHSAAAQTGAELVRASARSLDHALGAPEPWVNGFSPTGLIRGPAPFHPNAAGMQAVADAIMEHLD